MQTTAPDDLFSNEALRTLLQQDLSQIIEEEELSPDQGFLRVCIDYLGFDPEVGVVTDGKGDYGIDFIEVAASGADIIQAKSIEFEEVIDFDQKVGSSHITDLPRIRSLFENLDDLPPKMNAPVTRALKDLKHNLRSSGEVKKSDPFHITVYFCAQASGFTESANAEFNKIKTSPIQYGDVDIEITFIPVFFEDLLDAKWRQANTKWKNKKNEKREKFDFEISGSLIRDSSKSCVFLQRLRSLLKPTRRLDTKYLNPMLDAKLRIRPSTRRSKIQYCLGVGVRNSNI